MGLTGLLVLAGSLSTLLLQCTSLARSLSISALSNLLRLVLFLTPFGQLTWSLSHQSHRRRRLRRTVLWQQHCCQSHCPQRKRLHSLRPSSGTRNTVSTASRDSPVSNSPSIMRVCGEATTDQSSPPLVPPPMFPQLLATCEPGGQSCCPIVVKNCSQVAQSQQDILRHLLVPGTYSLTPQPVAISQDLLPKAPSPSSPPTTCRSSRCPSRRSSLSSSHPLLMTQELTRSTPQSCENSQLEPTRMTMIGGHFSVLHSDSSEDLLLQ